MVFTTIYALAALAAAPAPPTRTFIAGGRKFAGQDSAVCDIQGKWSNGEVLRYRAWDACAKMKFRRIAPSKKDVTVEQVHGKDRTFVIPAGAESFEISNDFSVVQVFRDRNGEMQEITLSD